MSENGASTAGAEQPSTPEQVVIDALIWAGGAGARSAQILAPDIYTRRADLIVKALREARYLLGTCPQEPTDRYEQSALDYAVWHLTQRGYLVFCADGTRVTSSLPDNDPTTAGEVRDA